MYIFILLNMFLVFFLNSDSSVQLLFQSEYSLYIGIFLLVLNFVSIGSQTKRIPFSLCYDLFAVGSVLVWLSYWPPFFREESPLFYVFSLYFSFITAFFSLLFKTQKESLGVDDIKNLQMLSNYRLTSPLIFLTTVIMSLVFPGHFLLFPVAITLLIIRFSLTDCLYNK